MRLPCTAPALRPLCPHWDTAVFCLPPGPHKVPTFLSCGWAGELPPTRAPPPPPQAVPMAPAPTTPPHGAHLQNWRRCRWHPCPCLFTRAENRIGHHAQTPVPVWVPQRGLAILASLLQHSVTRGCACQTDGTTAASAAAAGFGDRGVPAALRPVCWGRERGAVPRSFRGALRRVVCKMPAARAASAPGSSGVAAQGSVAITAPQPFVLRCV